jgi:hypothetical protein
MEAKLLVEDVGGMPPHTNLYQLNKSLYGFLFVNVCAFPEVNQTFVVGCNHEGVVEEPSMMGIYHSEYVPHGQALEACGYREVPIDGNF